VFILELQTVMLYYKSAIGDIRSSLNLKTEGLLCSTLLSLDSTTI